MREKRYWLLKSEPGSYSIDNLKKDKKTIWDGVRNYQARNFLRNMNVGDEIIFYHSSSDIIGAFGTGKISKEAIPDKSQFNEKSKYYDSRSKSERPLWFAVEVSFKSKFKRPVTLSEIKNNPKLKGIEVARTGSRLSVQPLSEIHYKEIVNSAGR